MDKKQQQKIFLPVTVIFIIVNCFCLVFSKFLDEHKIDHNVVISSNLLLFLIAMICLLMHLKAMKNKNPNVFFRSVMAATILKLFAIAGGICIYLYFAGKEKSLYAVLAAMVLYIFYTIAEVRTALILNKNINGSN